MYVHFSTEVHATMLVIPPGTNSTPTDNLTVHLQIITCLEMVLMGMVGGSMSGL